MEKLRSTLSMQDGVIIRRSGAKPHLTPVGYGAQFCVNDGVKIRRESVRRHSNGDGIYEWRAVRKALPTCENWRATGAFPRGHFEWKSIVCNPDFIMCECKFKLFWNYKTQSVKCPCTDRFDWECMETLVKHSRGGLAVHRSSSVSGRRIFSRSTERRQGITIGTWS